MDRTRLELEPGVWLDARRALWLEEWRVLAVADLHLGYAWAHRASGQLMPVGVNEDTTERLLALLDTYRADEVVVLGDVVHRAVSVPALLSELRWMALTIGDRAKLRLIGGNHDRGLAVTLAQAGLALEIDHSATVGPHLLLHGDEPDETVATGRLAQHGEVGGKIIFGHEHPAVVISDRVASFAKCPCFLVANGALILPAFSPWAAGADIRNKDFMSPYARQSRFDRAVAVVAGKLLPMRV